MISCNLNDTTYKMNKLKKYITDVIGLHIELNPLPKPKVEVLPLYIKEGYDWELMKLENHLFIIFSPKEEEQFSTIQIEKHREIIFDKLDLPTILCLDHLAAYNRKRLIEKKIAFVVPNKQLYIPEFLLDIRETGFQRKKETKQLTPTAQLVLLLFILDKYNRKQLESLAFNELAKVVSVKPMEITRAMTNLQELDLITIKGEKDKYISFSMERHELWSFAVNENILINPVIKKVYVDDLPNEAVLKSNTSALPEYTDMNPSKQKFYALEKNKYYQLKRENELSTPNPLEGRFCLEIWKYNPYLLSEVVEHEESIVDPLSLYLSLNDEHDERIEMALDQIIEKYTW